MMVVVCWICWDDLGWEDRRLIFGRAMVIGAELLDFCSEDRADHAES
jgi:hypothetical protein